MARAGKELQQETLFVGVDACRIRVQPGEPIVFVDARKQEDWAASTLQIAGALRLSNEQKPVHLPSPKHNYLVIYCAWMGQASSTRVVHQLREQGYSSAFVLRGGFEAWLNADGLVEEKVAVK
jgi:rhodanese-related sulfurtransferase